MTDAAGIVSAETLAKLLKITTRHLRNLVADGWIKKTREGKYTVVAGVHGFIDYKDDQISRGSQLAAKNRTGDARAREIELRIAQRERTLIPLDEAVAAMQVVAGALRAEMEGAAANITRDRELRNRIQDVHDGILKRSSERIEREAAALRSGGNADAPVEEDEPGGMGEGE